MPPPRPWPRIRSHRQADYSVLSIREDVVRDPRDGTEHPRAVIECPDWVQIIPVTRQGSVVMVRQYRVAAQANSLEMPGGMIDHGEAAQAAALRELEEETGYRPGQVVSLGALHPNPALQTNRCHVFLGLECEPAHGGRPEAAEDLEVERVDRAQLPERVRRGEISHALTVAALYLWMQIS